MNVMLTKDKEIIQLWRDEGWTYLHYNKNGKLIGVAPPPADNHEFVEVPKMITKSMYKKLKAKAFRQHFKYIIFGYPGKNIDG